MDRAMISGAWRSRGFFFVVGACGWPVGISAIAGGAVVGAGDVFWTFNHRSSAFSRHARFLGAVVVGWAKEGGVPSGR